MSWPIVRLDECTEIVSGATPKTGVVDYWGGDIAWATPKDLSNLNGKFIAETPDKITQSGYNSCSTQMLPPYSVLFSSRAPIGHVAVNTVAMCTNQGFKSFVPDANKLDASYLYYWLIAKRDYLQSLGNGATFKEVSKATVSRVEIPLPPLHEQRRIAAILDKAEALRSKRCKAIAKLDQLLQSVFLEMFGDPADKKINWPLSTLETVATTRLGKMLDKKTSQGNNMKKYLANLNVQWGRFILNDLREMNFDAADQQEFNLLSGDILMCEGGEPGRCAIWEDDVKDCYFQKALHRIRCNKEKCTPEYISYLFYILAKNGKFKSSITTATIAHLPGVRC